MLVKQRGNSRSFSKKPSNESTPNFLSQRPKKGKNRSRSYKTERDKIKNRIEKVNLRIPKRNRNEKPFFV
ncbi:hypothetical protein CH375_14190 [Leptospira ellisii]|nr:hypothetical protein CH375_14190 [Leptospira ellisii]